METYKKLWVFCWSAILIPSPYIQKEIALHSLEATIFHQDLIHSLLCRLQEDLHEVKGPIASFLAASDQTGILNAHSLPREPTS